MNKLNFKSFRVTSVKTSIDDNGISSKIKRGTCLINITEIATAFEDDLTGQVEVVMKRGDRFIVKNITLFEIQQMLRAL